MRAKFIGNRLNIGHNIRYDEYYNINLTDRNTFYIFLNNSSYEYIINDNWKFEEDNKTTEILDMI